MKELKKLEKLNKEQVINEMMKGTIKGGCCSYTYERKVLADMITSSGTIIPI